MPRPLRPVIERFWERIKFSDDCWEWGGYIRPDGYGSINKAGRGSGNITAHRLSWILHYGDIPDDLCVCHHCDNPKCVRPDHLFLGTQADNMMDCIAKKRNYQFPIYRGAKHGRAKLTDSDVIEIRQRYANGNISQETLGREYGVNQTMIGFIVRHKNWTHLP